MRRNASKEPSQTSGLGAALFGAGLVAFAAATAFAGKKTPRSNRRDDASRRFKAIVQAGPSKRRRKPPEAGIAVPAVPPKGPMPKQGGAEAPLDFDA